MLHVTCDVLGIAQYHLLKSTLSKFKAFLSPCAFENDENRTKTVLVTPIALNTTKLNKILLMLQFKR